MEGREKEEIWGRADGLGTRQAVGSRHPQLRHLAGEGLSSQRTGGFSISAKIPMPQRQHARGKPLISKSPLPLWTLSASTDHG